MDTEGRRKRHLALLSSAIWAAATIALTSAGGAGEAGTASAEARSAAPKPKIARDRISYGPQRRRQMARYSRRHYGAAQWKLRRADAIVLHFTAVGGYRAAWNTFQANAPNNGERPGVCAHYVVRKSGRTFELVPPRIRCRHAIGLNHRSIGIEMVQEIGRGPHWAARQILDRKRQSNAAVRLVRWLQRRFSIRTGDVIGHAMANDSRLFKDLRGWRNDHSDWLQREVREFRKRLRRR